jgi:hypothetical protein
VILTVLFDLNIPISLKLKLPPLKLKAIFYHKRLRKQSIYFTTIPKSVSRAFVVVDNYS